MTRATPSEFGAPRQLSINKAPGAGPASPGRLGLTPRWRQPLTRRQCLDWKPFPVERAQPSRFLPSPWHTAVMRKRVQIALAFLAFVVLGGTAIQFVEWKPRPLEPVIKGKSLNYWVQTENYHGPIGDEARAVVRQWGTNSIPLLCGWLRLNQPAYVESLFVREINKLLDILNVIPWRWRHAYEPNLTGLAYDVFCQLGPTGKAAIPTLIILLADRHDEAAFRASRILQKMAPESVPALIEALSSSNRNTRALAACALVESGGKS